MTSITNQDRSAVVVQYNSKNRIRGEEEDEATTVAAVLEGGNEMTAVSTPGTAAYGTLCGILLKLVSFVLCQKTLRLVDPSVLGRPLFGLI